MSQNQYFTDGTESSESERDPIYFTLKSALDRLRRSLRTIKRSSNMTDRLQVLTSDANNGRPLSVVLDVKIRWYSTITMLQRTIRIFPALNQVLDEAREPTFTRDDRQIFESILYVLEPMKDAMLHLCNARTTLAHADRIIVELLDIFEAKEASFTLAKAIGTAVKDEIKKRRTDMSSLLQYLLDPKYEPRAERALGQNVLSKKDRKKLIIEILRRENDPDLDVSEGDSDEFDISSPGTSSQRSTSQASRPFSTVFSALGRETPASESQATGDRIMREMRQHEDDQPRGKYLSLCLRRLLTIQPTSIKPERDFSVMNSVCTKSRNRLSPRTLDSLVTLREAFDMLEE